MQNFGKIKISFLMAAFAVSAECGFSQTPSSGVMSPDPVDIPIHHEKGSPTRPQLPSRQHVECVYVNGTLHFDFVIPEGEAVLTVTDGLTGISARYVFDTDTHAEVTIGYLSAASLEIHTDAGNTYAGTIQ